MCVCVCVCVCVCAVKELKAEVESSKSEKQRALQTANAASERRDLLEKVRVRVCAVLVCSIPLDLCSGAVKSTAYERSRDVGCSPALMLTKGRFTI